MHCPDRSVPTPVTDSGDERPILGHGNGFAKLHVHDGAGGSREGAARTVVTISVARDARGERTRNTQICAPGQIRQLGSRAARICLSSISQLLPRVSRRDAHQLPTLRGQRSGRSSSCPGSRGAGVSLMYHDPFGKMITLSNMIAKNMLLSHRTRRKTEEFTDPLGMAPAQALPSRVAEPGAEQRLTCGNP